jgi:hypothetical protein
VFGSATPFTSGTGNFQGSGLNTVSTGIFGFFTYLTLSYWESVTCISYIGGGSGSGASSNFTQTQNLYGLSCFFKVIVNLLWYI